MSFSRSSQFAHDQTTRQGRTAVSGDQIVVDPHVMSGAVEQASGVRAHVARPSGHQNLHAEPLIRKEYYPGTMNESLNLILSARIPTIVVRRCDLPGIRHYDRYI